MEDSPLGKCYKCGKQLEALDMSYASDRHLICNKCRALEPYDGLRPFDVTQLSSANGLIGDVFLKSGDFNQAFITQNKCKQCGAIIPATSVIIGELCASCQLTTNMISLTGALPSLGNSISHSIDVLRNGALDVYQISSVDPRDEEISKLHARIKEIEQKDAQGKEGVEALKQRLSQLEKELSPPRQQIATNPSFDDLCKVLDIWIPRCVRKYEEAYKSELAQYLSGKFLCVEEEARGQLCDILIAEKYPIHLKVNPTSNEYNTLSGQILSTLEQFDFVACIVLGASSFQRYEMFLKKLERIPNAASNIRAFIKSK